MMLVLTQKWAMNDWSGRPELVLIASGPAPFQSLHGTEILISSPISVNTTFFFLGVSFTHSMTALFLAVIDKIEGSLELKSFVFAGEPIPTYLVYS